MKKLLAGLATATLAVGLSLAGVIAPAAIATPPVDQVCPNYTTGHQSANSQTTFTYTAPAGSYIVGYCVKAGSANQGNGPETFTVAPTTSITFSHSSLKEISHFSVLLVQDQCLNLEGYQDAIPAGYLSDGQGGCIEDDPDPLVASASVSTTPPTCEAGETLVLGATSNASFGAPTLTVGPGTYEVVATADAGAEFPGALPTQTFTGPLAGPLTGPECDDPEVLVATASVSTTPPTCEAGETLVLGATSNASFGAPTLTVGPGNYEVVATAETGAAFAGGLPTLTFTGALAGPLTGPECDDPEVLVATASVSTTPPTCLVPETLVLGATSNASFGAPTLTVGPGNYEVVATAETGAAFPGGLPTKTFTGELAGTLTGPECDPPTLGLVMPAVSTTPLTCTTAGSYTLGAAFGYDASLLTWTVDGVPGVASGTYPVTSAKTVTVVANPVAPNGLEFGWVNPAPLVFEVPSVACAQGNLPTLAYTGSSSALDGGLLLAGGLMVLGALAVAYRRRSAQSAE